MQPVLKVHRVIQVHKALKEQQAQLVPKVQLELKELQVHKEHKVQ